MTDGFDKDAEEVFFKHLTKDIDLTKPDHPEEPETEPETPSEPEDIREDVETPSDGEAQPAEETHRYATDEDYVRITVGEDTHEVPVSELQRLYGQEANLTKRSQEFATQRQALESRQAEHLAAANQVLNFARQRWAPYANIDFLAMSRDPNISQEAFAALRAEAQTRWNELQFLEQGTGEYIQALQTDQQQRMKAAAQESLKQINDPSSPYHIENWSDKLYDDIRNYAINKGMSKDIVNSIVDPSAFKMIYNSMRFENGTGNVKTVKVNKQVTRVIKSSKASNITASKTDTAKATDKLKRSGSKDDAADAFYARFKEIGGVS